MERYIRSKTKLLVELAESIGNMTKQRFCETLSDPKSVEALMACQLILLDNNPGLRPIGIGEMLRRMIGKAVSSNSNF